MESKDVKGDRDILVKALVEAYADALRRIRDAKIDCEIAAYKLYNLFKEWLREKEENRSHYIYGSIQDFYEEMGIKDPIVRAGLTIRFDKQAWRERP